MLAPMHPLFGAYESRLLRLRRHQRTLRNYRNAIRQYEAFLREAGTDPAQAKPRDVEDFLASLPHALSTQRLFLENVRAAYAYARKRGELSHDPTFDVELPKLPDKEPQVITPSELRTMREGISQEREWMIFHLLAYTGMRRTEIRQLTWGDVSLPDKTLTVLGKGGKLRKVPIHPVLGEALAEQYRYSQYVVPRARSEQSFHDAVRSFTDYTPHAFRRTVSSSLYANGVATDTIDKILGWAPREVRSRYYQSIAPLQLHTAILRLYADDPL